MKKWINSFLLISTLALMGCEKFLEEKPNKKLVVPSTVASIQTLLDDYSTLNQKEVTTGISTCDDFTMSTANWLSLDQNNRNLYVWSANNAFVTGAGSPWTTLYANVYKANVVLDRIDDAIDRTTNLTAWGNVKGQALFLRARSYLNLLSIWSLPYDQATSTTDMGVPLRLDVNFNTPSVRASVEVGYQQVLNDLRAAAALLPNYPVHVIRPSKPAAYAFLARAFLTMNKPDSCLKYTALALQLKSNLMDYNASEGINSKAEYPFLRFNPEVIFETYMPYPATLQKGDIDKELYDSYATNDLRKTMYHRSATAVGIFKGTYSGGTFLFNGPATDELYLMKAESLARLEDKEGALTTLNELVLKRFKTGTFVPYTATTVAEVLQMVLLERRKELVFRGLRWMDVRRLNKIGANITMKRQLNGVDYLVKPNELRYALPIPEDIVELTGMPQNYR
ncbi:RagB/SusD family nutrient uptake outer membrane protein [Pedobacter sp. LMG 31464]|uniref:RagB/SusD family nutrient uptake outer membrane protein n=1 Tax=Pedobacter planticolens TaxID=2679964 RepID=A0A923DVB6_9SPHI|nr:RagB/SusD family nutrient uptake outer membrane protein [Pedobacter planticolens]MBB2144589.1 RagB/SusD family nutrient uptake outer membrane protein [Pedobacter planticolens]